MTKISIPGFDQKEFREQMKEISTTYESSVRNKTAGSQDSGSTNNNQVPQRSQSIHDFTQYEWEQRMFGY